MITSGEQSTAELTLNTFDFHLPSELIAQHPPVERDQSRLLIVPACRADLREIKFAELGQLLNPGDLLICNDSKVIPARLPAQKPTGGRVEILVERLESKHRLQAQLKTSRALRIGDSIFVDRHRLTVTGRRRELFILQSAPNVNVQAIIDSCGTIPLPPYIRRPVESEDQRRYQTVYARHEGSVAAPTAGLHFTNELLQSLAEAEVEVQYVTLHIGAGTFAPVRGSDVKQHSLHRERCHVSRQVCDAVGRARRRKARIIAVGTTTVRVLETATQNGQLQPYDGETELFIKPGFRFNVVEGMITNFHLPGSTLLMLVCAFGGLERVMDAYRYAVQHKFRFYSYGDAMFLTRGVDE